MEKSTNPQPTYSVSDFIAVINQTLEFAYPSVEIEGEVASFKVNQDKFVFFDIKDSSGSIGCFMTVWQLRVPIEDGMKIVVSAIPKLTQWGKFSLTVKSVRPSGEGALKKSFELLKNKLEIEGLFEQERKRTLPSLPQHIAVISSTGAAGYADFIKIIGDRWGGLTVDVANVQVQGQGSADQIIHAIEYFNQQLNLPEVIVIIRGGGSADDLSTFHDELLVRAVAGSRIPTLIGVGHETDQSLADMASDVNASTPSNAAQILVPDRNEIIRNVKIQKKSLIPRMIQIIDQQSIEIKDKLKNIIEKIELATDSQMTIVSNLKNVLVELDPNKVLERGYAIVRGVIKSGVIIEIEMKKAILEAEVKNVTSK